MSRQASMSGVDLTNASGGINHADSALATLARHGKTFNWARRLLGPHTGLAAARLYSFCRHVDDVADGDAPGGGALLARIKDALHSAAVPPDTETERFLALAAETGIDLGAAQSLLSGLLSDQNLVAIEDEDALIVYAYRVAGTVGLMMAPILGCRHAAAQRHAIDLGIAMQLTNIARDVAEDAELGRRYLPGDWCDGASAKDICAATAAPNDHRVPLQRAVLRLLDLADVYYRSGYQGLAALPLRAHLSIATAGYCYQAIGHKLRRRNGAFWRGRVVIGSAGKTLASIQSLQTLRTRGRGQTPHNARLHNSLAQELKHHGSL